MKLRKLCCHPSLLETSDQDVSDLALSGKLQVLDALLQAIKHSNPGDKVVIVSNFTTVLSIIERIIFKARKGQYLSLDSGRDSFTER
jgi:SNF2 family DNA or RNA helicase